MSGSSYNIGWPTTNPTQFSPWGFAPFAGQGFGSPQSSHVLQLLQVVPQQLQNLQQLTYFQLQQFQQLQQVVQQIAYLALHQLQQPSFGQPFQGIPQFGQLQGIPQFGQQIVPAPPAHVM